jgi:hypothetical protein
MARDAIGVAALALTLELLTGRPALGQEDAKAVAARTFREGSAAFERHDFVAGARSFEASFRAIPRAAAIYNAALCWDAAAAQARAADAYATALSKTDLHGTEAEKAAGRLRELEAALGVVDVTGPEGAHVVVEEVAGAPPLHVHLSPGSHEVSVHFATGQQQLFNVRVRPGEHKALAVDAPRSPEAALAPRAPGNDGSGRIWGWTLLGGGAAFAAAAGVLGAETMQALDTFRASGDHDSLSHDRAVTLRTLTDVSCGLAAALAAGGAALVLWSHPATGVASDPRSATLSMGPAGVSVSGRF